MPPSEVAPQIYLLSLDDTGSPDIVGSKYINLPAPRKPYTLRFAIEGTSSICREGSLWINIPEEGQEFERTKFREFKLRPSFGQSLYIDIPIVLPGTFSYYITYTPLPPFSAEETLAKPLPTKTPLHYITVKPTLSVNGEDLALDSINMFSVLSKFLGPVDRWDNYMKYIAAKGYNMVHFTPLMQRGASNSPFSLFNQQKFDPIAFPGGEKDIQTIVQKMEKEHGLLALTDIVWNHTAENSEWLQHHPEAGYNRVTAPWLESAYQFDTALLEFNRELAELGMPTEVKNAEDLQKLMEGIKEHVVEKIKLWEFYVIDRTASIESTLEAWKAGQTGDMVDKLKADGYSKESTITEKANIVKKHGLRGDDRLGERFRKYVEPAVGAAYLELELGPAPADQNEETVASAGETYKALVDELNLPYYKEYDVDIADALEQIHGRIEYTRLAEHGPKRGPFTEQDPVAESYFTRLPINEITKKHDPKSLALANNGWLWDNTSDFASAAHKCYLRREVISWGDCVKLRYGDKPEDSPFLWEFMAEYTRILARNFHGFRIDNSHSTPLHVGEYMLDVARRVRPNLYTVAELFTGNEKKDQLFLERLGLSSLIREAMTAWGPQELSRLVHRHGGKPIGSFEQEFVTRRGDINAVQEREEVRAVTSAPIHALFMDCTHDNEVPAQKRTPQDSLPNGALAAMCDCGIGSVMGYDEIYPKLLDLVHESRNYNRPPTDLESPTDGIAKVKAIMNGIHSKMGKEGYTEMHVHHEGEYITVHRVHPQTHHGYFLVAHTAFGPGDHRGEFSPVNIPMTKAKALGSWTLKVDGSPQAVEETLADETTLRGLPTELVDAEPSKIETHDGGVTITIPDVFPPGSIALFETWVEGFHGKDIDMFLTSGVESAMGELTLAELNLLLYRCDAEERDLSGGKDGVYDVPGHGKLVYAGLQGWWSVIKHIIANNDLAHPLCNHLREGHWPLDYTAGRLERLSKDYPGLEKPAKWLRLRFEKIKTLPATLLPRYFALVIQTAYTGAVERALGLFGPDIRDGTPFLKQLALVNVQMTGYTNSASLWPNKLVPSMAAGLPHFAVEWARCWGRDVFISIRGLYLVAGRFDDAKEHILAFASVLKHGLIPNLLGAGRIPRYNARDAIWFFLQSIQDYATMAPNGLDILKEKTPRRFLPNDDTWFPVEDERAYSKESTIEEVIIEALQYHAQGIKYREANAGPSLDSQMTDEGFNVEVQPDWETGLIFGGNRWNCGTWMDKMGESERAGSKGHPGTPRDGAAVEINGLLYSTLDWVSKLHEQGKFSSDSATKADGSKITYSEWAALIKENFERIYYIPTDPSKDSEYVIDANLVNRRGIYKDLYKSSSGYEDYQLRPNFFIAMAVAPDLFTPAHALQALTCADIVLRGPLGMATLDHSDQNYRPNYDNAEDSDDYATSKGRNYHQGPEWVWPLGYFLRAVLKFDSMRRKTSEERLEMLQQLAVRMENCRKEIENSPWAGLPELTNQKGAYCRDSSPTQAWSASCLMDLFYDAREVERSSAHFNEDVETAGGVVGEAEEEKKEEEKEEEEKEEEEGPVEKVQDIFNQAKEAVVETVEHAEEATTPEDDDDFVKISGEDVKEEETAKDEPAEKEVPKQEEEVANKGDEQPEISYAEVVKSGDEDTKKTEEEDQRGEEVAPQQTQEVEQAEEQPPQKTDENASEMSYAEVAKAEGEEEERVEPEPAEEPVKMVVVEQPAKTEVVEEPVPTKEEEPIKEEEEPTKKADEDVAQMSFAEAVKTGDANVKKAEESERPETSQATATDDDSDDEIVPEEQPTRKPTPPTKANGHDEGVRRRKAAADSEAPKVSQESDAPKGKVSEESEGLMGESADDGWGIWLQTNLKNWRCTVL